MLFRREFVTNECERGGMEHGLEFSWKCLRAYKEGTSVTDGHERRVDVFRPFSVQANLCDGRTRKEVVPSSVKVYPCDERMKGRTDGICAPSSFFGLWQCESE